MYTLIYSMYTLLQLTASSFSIPLIMALLMNKWLGVIIYFLNLITSLYVHRENRTKVHTFTDKFDRFIIFVWFIYNCYNYYISISSESLLDLNISKKWFRKLSRIFVVFVLITKILIIQFPWRTPIRNKLHG